MPNFIFSFDGGRAPSTDAEAQKSMQDWQAWMGKIGDAIVDGGGPVGKSKTVSASGTTEGGGAEPLMGYTIVKADTMDAAVALLDTCPHFEMGGTCEVAEVIEM